MTLSTEIARLLGANVDGLDWSTASGGNVFEQDWPNEPDLSVQVNSAGGPEPSAQRASDEHHIQLIFRAPPEDSLAAESLWYRAFDYLHALRRVQLSDGSFLAWVLAQQAEPVRIGADENGRQRFAMNLRVQVYRPSGQRP